MNNSSPFGFDPSKMDPKVMMEVSRLVQSLPPGQLNKMQTLMHNMMAGFDVRKEMEEFERSLPPGFREKLMSVFGAQAGGMVDPGPSMGIRPAPVEPAPEVIETSAQEVQEEMSLREARMTILRGVAEGRLAPEEAERLLFRSA